ncbi:MAG TPA: methyltransferase domain-containing protein [Gammaproteobacteria bacterium]
MSARLNGGAREGGKAAACGAVGPKRRAAPAPRASPRWLGDAPERSYARKLDLFGRFIVPELRRIFADLSLPATGAVLDLGCGTGVATAVLREALAPGVLLVGTDLSMPHLAAARRHHSEPLVQSDAARLAFRHEAFDLIWACNAINHLVDPAATVRALGGLLRAGGRLVVAQSGLLPEMFFAWDAALDDAVRSACHAHYRQRYGLAADDLASIRALVGWLRAAGFEAVTARTYVIERTQPLSPVDREYFQQAVFEGTWGAKVEPHLDPASRVKLRRYCDPASPEYCLDREDFHHLQTLTVCVGTRPAGAAGRGDS